MATKNAKIEVFGGKESPNVIGNIAIW